MTSSLGQLTGWGKGVGMFPGLPTSLHGDLVIGAVDEECQARVITRHGKLWGAWVDDTTFNAEHDLSYYVGLTVAKYVPRGLKVMVCVPSGQPRKRYRKPIIAVYEWYPYGSGAPRSAWPKLPPRGFRAYVCQWNFPGVAPDAKPLTRRQRLGLLAGIMLRHPRYVFKF